MWGNVSKMFFFAIVSFTLIGESPHNTSSFGEARKRAELSDYRN